MVLEKLSVVSWGAELLAWVVASFGFGCKPRGGLAAQQKWKLQLVPFFCSPLLHHHLARQSFQHVELHPALEILRL